MIQVLAYADLIQICKICQTNNGACIGCTSCGVALHVECAMRAAYVLGFDIQAIKSSQSRRESLTLVRLGADGGLMTPVVHCPTHDLKRQNVHRLHEVSNESGLSALALYIKTYKILEHIPGRTSQAKVMPSPDDEFKFIQTLHGGLGDSNHKPQNPIDMISPKNDLNCAICHTRFSAHFFREPIPGITEAPKCSVLCHQCHWKLNTTIRKEGV